MSSPVITAEDIRRGIKRELDEVWLKSVPLFA